MYVFLDRISFSAFWTGLIGSSVVSPVFQSAIEARRRKKASSSSLTAGVTASGQTDASEPAGRTHRTYPTMRPVSGSTAFKWRLVSRPVNKLFGKRLAIWITWYSRVRFGQFRRKCGSAQKAGRLLAASASPSATVQPEMMYSLVLVNCALFGILDYVIHRKR